MRKNPDYVAVYSQIEFFDTAGNISSYNYSNTIQRIKDASISKEIYLSNNFGLTTQGLMISRIIQNEIFEVLDRNLLQDWPINIYLFTKYLQRVGFIEETLTALRHHGGNTYLKRYKVLSLCIDTIYQMVPEEYKEKALLMLINSNGFINRRKRFRLFKSKKIEYVWRDTEL